MHKSECSLYMWEGQVETACCLFQTFRENTVQSFLYQAIWYVGRYGDWNYFKWLVLRVNIDYIDYVLYGVKKLRWNAPYKRTWDDMMLTLSTVCFHNSQNVQSCSRIQFMWRESERGYCHWCRCIWVINSSWYMVVKGVWFASVW